MASRFRSGVAALAVLAALAGPLAADPFWLGAWVGADPHRWGDLKGMGTDTPSTIDGVCADLARLGCNAVWVSGFAPGFAETDLMAVWLATASRHGLQVVLQGSGPPYAIPKDEPEASRLARTRREVLPKWEEIARRFAKHPALLAYCPVEEIGDNVEEGQAETLRCLVEVGEAVARIDPVHPVTTIHIATWIAVARAEARLRGRNLKVLAADLYVFTHVHDWSDASTSWKTPDEATRAYLDWTGRHVELARANRVPFWLFAQANSTTWTKRQGQGLATRPNFRMPTPAEMRFQVWGAIASGARGLFFFPYNSNPPPPPESRRDLAEWEHGTGLRTLDGQPSPSHAGLLAAGPALRPHLALLGRMEPEGPAVEEERVVGRPFRDPQGGRRWVVLANRDVARERPVPAALATRLGIRGPARLGAGEGKLLER